MGYSGPQDPVQSVWEMLDPDPYIMNTDLKNTSCSHTVSTTYNTKLLPEDQCFGSALVSMRIRINHFRSMWIWISRVLMTKNWKKCTSEKKFVISLMKNCNLVIPKTPKRTSKLQQKVRNLHPSKENIQHFKTWNFLTFFYFCRSFCPPGSGSGSSRPKSMRIRIRNTAEDEE